MKQTNKQLQTRLISNIIERLTWEGATLIPDQLYDAKLSLNTSMGVLSIKIQKDDLRRSIKNYGEPTLTAFCKFENPTAIKAFNLTGNKFTGKWNWHFLNSRGVDAFIHNIALIMDNPIQKTKQS